MNMGGVAPEPFAVAAAAIAIWVLALIIETTKARGKKDVDSDKAHRRDDRHRDPEREVVEVTVLGNNGPQIRMGVTAPKHTSIDREEIYKRKKAEASHG